MIISAPSPSANPAPAFDSASLSSVSDRPSLLFALLLLQAPRETADRWEAVLSRLFQLGKLEAFYDDVVVRIPPLLDAEPACVVLEAITSANGPVVDLFFNLVRKSGLSYYSHAELGELLGLIMALIRDPKALSQALSCRDVPPFDQGGKDLLCTWLGRPRARSRAHIDPRVRAVWNNIELSGPGRNNGVGVLNRMRIGLRQCIDGSVFFIAQARNYFLIGSSPSFLEQCITQAVEPFDIAEVHYSRFAPICARFFNNGESGKEIVEIIVFLLAKIKDTMGMSVFVALTQPHRYEGCRSGGDMLELLQRILHIFDTGKLDDRFVSFLSDFHGGSISFQTFLGAVREISSMEAFEERQSLDFSAVFSAMRWHIDKKDPTVFSELSEILSKLQKRFGKQKFLSFFNPASYQHIHNVEQVSETLTMLLESQIASSEAIAPLLISFRNARLSIQELHRTLASAIVLQVENESPDLPEAIVQKTTHLSRQQQAVIVADYEQIQTIGRTVRSQPTSELRKKVETIRDRCEQGSMSREDMLHAVAISREALLRTIGIYPYATQVLALLCLIHHDSHLKGRLAQVRTGEGKSTIVAMLAFFHACQGLSVDVVSSSRYLAQRDERKYRRYFGVFGIPTSHLCTDSPTSVHFAGQIIFSTNFDLEFAVMRDFFRPVPMRVVDRGGTKIPRPFHVVIVDEVDNLFIDSALNSARIAIPSKTSFSTIYEPILSFVRHNQRSVQQWLLIDSIAKQLLPENISVVTSLTESIRSLLSPRMAKLLSPARMILLLRSAARALELRENEDYVLQSTPKDQPLGKGQRQVVIVDKNNTGRLSEKSRWSHGLHQFVEVKHGLKPLDEQAMPASLSHPRYFSQYMTIYGLTGTIGTRCEREEVCTTYSIDAVEIPPHKPCLRQEYAPIICSSREDLHTRILGELRQMIGLGRPSLVLLESINETQAFVSLLRKVSLPFHMLNAVQQEDEDFLVHKAGVAGAVTVATNTAGRGTDIVLSKRSLQNGGLHVIFSYFPSSMRVEEQGFGRAGRQGQPGSCRMIARGDSYQQLVAEREENISRESQKRMCKISLERANHTLMMQFTHQLHQWQADLDRHFLTSVHDSVEALLQKTSPAPRNDLDPEDTSLQTTFFKTIEQHTPDQRKLFYQSVANMLRDRCIQDWSELVYDRLDEVIQTALEKNLDTKTYADTIQKLYNREMARWHHFFSSPKASFLQHVQKVTGIQLV